MIRPPLPPIGASVTDSTGEAGVVTSHGKAGVFFMRLGDGTEAMSFTNWIVDVQQTEQHHEQQTDGVRRVHVPDVHTRAAADAGTNAAARCRLIAAEQIPLGFESVPWPFDQAREG